MKIVYNSNETVKDMLYNDFTSCYEVDQYSDQNNMSKDIDSYKEGELYYYPSLLSFGDYDNSGAVERANVRVFMEQFKGNKWVKYCRGAYSSEYIGIDVFCNDPEIIEVLEGLSDYPCINDESVSEVEFELANESWSNWIERDVKDAIEKNFNIDLDDYYYNSEDLQTWFNTAAESLNIYGHVESGGNYWIDVNRIVENTIELPANFTSNPVLTD